MSDTGMVQVKQEPADTYSAPEVSCTYEMSRDDASDLPQRSESDGTNIISPRADNPILGESSPLNSGKGADNSFSSSEQSGNSELGYYGGPNCWPMSSVLPEQVSVDYLDVPKVVHEFKTTLERFGLSQRFASKYIMKDTSQGNLSFLLEKGRSKNWEELSPRGRVPYIRMQAWLDSKEQQIQTLEMLKTTKAFNKPGPKDAWYRREKFSPFQLTVLCRLFEENANPTIGIRTAVAKKLNIHIERINVWFQNQRARGFPAKKILANCKGNKSLSAAAENFGIANNMDSHCDSLGSNQSGLSSTVSSFQQLSNIQGLQNSGTDSRLGPQTDRTMSELDASSISSHLLSLQYLQQSVGSGVAQDTSLNTSEIPHLYSRAFATTSETGLPNDSRTPHNDQSIRFMTGSPFHPNRSSIDVPTLNSHLSSENAYSQPKHPRSLSSSPDTIKQKPKNLQDQSSDTSATADTLKRRFISDDIRSEESVDSERVEKRQKTSAAAFSNFLMKSEQQLEDKDKDVEQLKQARISIVPFFNFLTYKKTEALGGKSTKDRLMDTEQNGHLEADEHADNDVGSQQLSAIEELTLFTSGGQQSTATRKGPLTKSLANLRKLKQDMLDSSEKDSSPEMKQVSVQTDITCVNTSHTLFQPNCSHCSTQSAEPELSKSASKISIKTNCPNESPSNANEQVTQKVSQNEL